MCILILLLCSILICLINHLEKANNEYDKEKEQQKSI